MRDPESSLLAALRAHFGHLVEPDRCSWPIAAFLMPDFGAENPIQMRFGASEGTARELFLAERDLVRTLHHRNIVAVLHEGDFDGHAYYAVRRPNPLLDDRLRSDQHLPLVHVLAILRDMAAALAHCHENGVVHGAIDPLRIADRPEGAVLDGFYIAAVITVLGTPYQEGYAIGTPIYCSPELLSGHPIDERSDIYSLGMIAYVALAGEAPWANEADWGCGARLKRYPPTPKLKSAEEKRLYGVIRQMLAPRPAARFQSSVALLRALEGLGA